MTTEPHEVYSTNKKYKKSVGMKLMKDFNCFLCDKLLAERVWNLMCSSWMKLYSCDPFTLWIILSKMPQYWMELVNHYTIFFCWTTNCMPVLDWWEWCSTGVALLPTWNSFEWSEWNTTILLHENKLYGMPEGVWTLVCTLWLKRVKQYWCVDLTTSSVNE